jgi:hypothetical protein
MTEQVDAQVAVPQQEQPRGPVTRIRVTVNRQPVELPDRELTGLQIKVEAIGQGVDIQQDFPLSVMRGGQYVAVGDQEPIRVHAGEEFLAVAPDDNS